MAVNKTDDEQDKPTIEQTAYVLRRVLDHMRQGGTYRYLIYDRLGYGTESYAPLMCAGGLDISNLCPVETEEDWLPFISSVQPCEVVGVLDKGRKVVVNFREYNDEIITREVDLPDGMTAMLGDMVMVAYVCRPSSGTLEVLPREGWAQRDHDKG